MSYTIYLQSSEDRPASDMFARLMRLWHHVEVTGRDTADSDIVVIRDDALPAEGFDIRTGNRCVIVSGRDTRGVAYGLSELTKRCSGATFGEGRCASSPAFPIRGAHVFLPAEEDIEGFKRLVDMLVYLKYNTLIVEVGGGMEYKRHPEINMCWERFCRDLLDFPNGPEGFQGSDSMWKNAPHVELAGGSYLPQTAVRDLVEYAKAYGLNVVPEIQTLSHAYYLLNPYPELAERTDDHKPDTVCPMNEDAYALYFEVAEEVLEVFRPEMVSVGHDEIRVMGICPRCREKTGHELLAYEMNRLYDFYTKKGLNIAMWGEKLQYTFDYFTKEYSGGAEGMYDNGLGRTWRIPAMHQAIDRIPKNILLLDWRYCDSWESQDYTEKHGFQQIFGNFHGEITRKWKQRTASPAVLGAEVSTWCSPNEHTLGFDGRISDLWFSAMMLWDRQYDEEAYDTYLLDMRRALPRLREGLRGIRSAYASLRHRAIRPVYAGRDSGTFVFSRGALPSVGLLGMWKAQLPEQLYGQLLGERETVIRVNGKADRLLFVHTCLGDKKRHYIRNFTDPFTPVVYAVRYVDGETSFVHGTFGKDVGSYAARFGRRINFLGSTPEDDYARALNEEDCADPPTYRYENPWQDSLMYSTLPVETEGGMVYVTEWENPRPGVSLEKVIAVSTVRPYEEQVVLFAAAVVEEEEEEIIHDLL